jgi:hypothetical protein
MGWAEADINISLAGGPQLTIDTLKKAETIEVNSNGMIGVRNLNLEKLRSYLAIGLRNRETSVGIMVETQNGYKSLCNVTKSEMKDDKLVISLWTDDNNLAPAGAYKSAKLTFYSHGEKSEYVDFYGASFATWDKSNSQLTVNKADQLPGNSLTPVIASIGQKLLIIGNDGNGNTNKMVARVKV